MNLVETFYHNFMASCCTSHNKKFWPELSGCLGLMSSLFVEHSDKPVMIICENIAAIIQLEQELSFFLKNTDIFPIVFPDWETLPYDYFSPHEDIISGRLATLSKLPYLKKGVILVAVSTLMHRLPPKEYLQQNSLLLKCGDILNSTEFCRHLGTCGYRRVTTVMEHGEFTVRGSIIDIFPMGSLTPLRIDLLDEEIESIRLFNPDSQLSSAKINKIELLPAKEFPLTKEAITRFKQQWLDNFDSPRSPIYQAINDGESVGGVEYYLPLFFDHTATFFDYLPPTTIAINHSALHENAAQFWSEITERYEQLRHDQLRPLLTPAQVFLTVDELFGRCNEFQRIEIAPLAENSGYRTLPIPDISLDNKTKNPLHKLQIFLEKHQQAQILFCAESLGRKETILELLRTINLTPTFYPSWKNFLAATDIPSPNDFSGFSTDRPEQFDFRRGGEERATGVYSTYMTVASDRSQQSQKLKCEGYIGLTIGSLHSGLWLETNNQSIIVITEKELFGYQPTIRQRKYTTQDPEALVRNLVELHIGDPIIHLEHGIGRYLGLQIINIDEQDAEFLAIEYANQAKLYVPVSSLHLIRRFTGANAESVQYNQLGSNQWEKTKRQAAAKIKDIAAELLELYAKRAAAAGFAFQIPAEDYRKFSAEFTFEETADQARAIQNVMTDMQAPKSMDRLICGDVGFGKTEVAIRAAFIAVNNSKQVIILVPTTILAQQHYQNFQNRFANWPFKIEMLSRFRSTKEQKNILQQLANGQIDIIIGTHKLLQPTIKFKDLGLLIIDEEHRFGVKQKEKIKALRNNIDMLALTATPIPRTLNMALSGIREFSIIATPPAKRLAIKTFVHESNHQLIREALVREILRGGQVYFLHNNITSIERVAEELTALAPNIKLIAAHGQMPTHDLERIMNDFYHQRYNVLVCTTIIESGIDIPTANTIIIDRADKFGLAQLHQLRGRVGRSTHQAYAYLLTLPEKHLTADAVKRLDAIASMEDLGAGFNLATHDLEIRGAGELLGEEQSGQIESIGFSLYLEYLERAVDALKNHQDFTLENSISQTEIELQVPALIPANYVDDVNLRLILYKRMANTKNMRELQKLQEEIIDRFGILPLPTKNLFNITAIKFQAEQLGIQKITVGNNKGMIEFIAQPNIDPQKIIKLIQSEPQCYKIKGNNKLEFCVAANFDNRINFIAKLLERLE